MKRHLILAAAAMMASLPAQAAYIGIHDDHNTVTISDGQFEGGFYANGNQLSSGYNSGTFSVNTGTQLDFTGSWVSLGLGSGTFDIYVLANAGDTDAIGHLFGSAVANGSMSTITGTYLSGGTFAVGGGTTVVAGNAADFSFAFSSNTLTVDQVPEPAMLGLFGLGAIGLGLSRRRKA